MKSLLKLSLLVAFVMLSAAPAAASQKYYFEDNILHSTKGFGEDLGTDIVVLEAVTHISMVWGDGSNVERIYLPSTMTDIFSLTLSDFA